jgi:hypothetical protein
VQGVNAGARAWFLAVALLAVGTLFIARALWPELAPLTQRTPLPDDARSTEAGIPVPAAAARCAATVADEAAGEDFARWCMPTGVSADTLARWYADALPAGRDAGGLRWCVEQRQADGGRRALWSTGDALVGYVLPPEHPRPPVTGSDDAVAVEVVVLSGSACHPATRTGREQG